MSRESRVHSPESVVRSRLAALTPPPPSTTRAEGRALTPPLVRTNISLAWDNPPGQPAYPTEFWATQDLRQWYYVGEVPAGQSNVVMAITHSHEFYRCRYRLPTGGYSGWNQ